MNFIWQHSENFYWLWCLPILVLLLVYATQARKKYLQRFALNALAENAPLARQRFWAAALNLLAVLLLIIALARPASDPQTEKRQTSGRSVIFLLDVSRSMLATDLLPNRLERARLAIRDCLEKIHGDRIALIAFAGNAKLLCPLTTDYDFFRYALQKATPEIVERGGTMIGDALRKSLEIIKTQNHETFTDLLLITDGGDSEIADESFALNAAQKLGERGVRIIAIGIGDERDGQRIPITKNDGKREFLTYQGREVWDKLNGEILRAITKNTPHGVYLNVATGTFDLGEIYHELVATAEKNALGEKVTLRYQENFQLFLALAIGGLLCAPLLRHH